MMRIRFRLGLFALALTTVGFVTSCATQYTIFAPVGKVTVPQGSIAVLSGLGDDLSVSFAAQVTNDLETDSSFAVVTQPQITAKFSAYPANILDDPHSFSEADRAKFTRIARGLGVSNILVVWIYNAESTSSGFLATSLHFAVGGRLLSYPGGRITGTSDFGYSMGQGLRTEGTAVNEMVVKAADILVKKLVETTGTAKAG